MRKTKAKWQNHRNFLYQWCFASAREQAGWTHWPSRLCTMMSSILLIRSFIWWIRFSAAKVAPPQEARPKRTDKLSRKNFAFALQEERWKSTAASKKCQDAMMLCSIMVALSYKIGVLWHIHPPPYWCISHHFTKNAAQWLVSQRLSPSVTMAERQGSYGWTLQNHWKHVVSKPKHLDWIGLFIFSLIGFPG